MKKEIILEIFDKATGYGDWADHVELEPVRNEFIKLLCAAYRIEGKVFLSRFSPEALSAIDNEIKKEGMPS